MRKEIEINGCVEISCEISIDEFTDAFIEWIESKGWHFGGGFGTCRARSASKNH